MQQQWNRILEPNITKRKYNNEYNNIYYIIITIIKKTDKKLSDITNWEISIKKTNKTLYISFYEKDDTDTNDNYDNININNNHRFDIKSLLSLWQLPQKGFQGTDTPNKGELVIVQEDHIYTTILLAYDPGGRSFSNESRRASPGCPHNHHKEQGRMNRIRSIRRLISIERASVTASSIKPGLDTRPRGCYRTMIGPGW